MRERRVLLIDVKWKDATATLEFSRKIGGAMELRIPFLMPEPFIMDIQEMLDVLNTIQDQRDA